jgi:hypothetical protein
MKVRFIKDGKILGYADYRNREVNSAEDFSCSGRVSLLLVEAQEIAQHLAGNKTWGEVRGIRWELDESSQWLAQRP